jgi:hypothetical protein
MDRNLSIVLEMELPMNAPPAVYGQFGQAVAFAERSLTATLREHLAERNVEPETWYALQLIATRGPGLARGELSQVLEGSPNLDAESTRQLLARLEADGLIRGGATLDLTSEGQEMHASLRAYIAEPTTALLSQFDLGEIETTVRTLRAITAKADQRLLAPSS